MAPLRRCKHIGGALLLLALALCGAPAPSAAQSPPPSSDSGGGGGSECVSIQGFLACVTRTGCTWTGTG